MRIGVSQVLILIAFMFSFVLAMSAAFLAAPAIASDVETGTVHAMLARPLRRAELVVGPLARAVDRRRRVRGPVRPPGHRRRSGSSSGHVPPAPARGGGLPRVPVRRRPDARARARDTAAVDRRRGDHRRPVRPRLVRGGAGQHRRRVRRGAARRRRRHRPRAAADRRPVAGRDLRARAAARAPDRGAGRNAEAMRANPFFAATPPPAAFVAWAVAWVALVLVAGIALFRRREL